MKNRAKRPFSVTCLSALVLTFTAAHILRIWVALSNFAFYRQLPLRISPLYFVLSGLVWGGISLVVALGLWQGRPWAPNSLRWGVATWLAFSWFDRLALQAPGPQSMNWPFALGISIVLLVCLFGVLALPKARAYYGEYDEQSLEN